MAKNRKIAIITDCHGLLEPLEATIDDIRKQDIEEIYSLGDNVGTGSNPSEVMDLIIENNIKSIAGNAEYYIALGAIPFLSYFNLDKFDNVLWTINQLKKEHIEYIKNMPSSIELELGNKKIALCHFAGDVRTDWLEHGQSRFQSLLNNKKNAYQLFEYTNSQEQIEFLEKVLKVYGNGSYATAIESQLKDPLFGGKSVHDFDWIIQGHTHFEVETGNFEGTNFYTLRANGLGYGDDDIDMASYVILTETSNGFEIQKRLVKYDHEKMIKSITNSDMPDKSILEWCNPVK